MLSLSSNALADAGAAVLADSLAQKKAAEDAIKEDRKRFAERKMAEHMHARS